MVISYVMDGLKLVDKYNLFKVIKDFISIYYGCGKIKFFYIFWKNEYLGEELNEEVFMYLGFNLFLKEIVILMMVDFVEVVLCSLLEYIEESISNLVDKIIDL